MNKSSFKSNIKYLVIVLVVLVIFPIGGAIFGSKIVTYKLGNMYLNSEEYDRAVVEFNKVSDYKDSKEKIKESHYRKAVKLMDNYLYQNALDAFKNVPKDYKDTTEKINETRYRYGLYFIDYKGYDEAIEQFKYIPNYKDSKAKLIEIKKSIH